MASVPMFSSMALAASGIPPHTIYLRYSRMSLLRMISGSFSMASKWSTYSKVALSDARRNSRNDRGNILMTLTLPTGTVILRLFTATPSREPAAMMWYCGASSQKYFRLLSASSHSCISSKMIRVLPSMMGTVE